MKEECTNCRKDARVVAVYYLNEELCGKNAIRIDWECDHCGSIGRIAAVEKKDRLKCGNEG